MTKYRVVTGRYANYEIQVKYRWWPFWMRMPNGFFWINAFATIEGAEDEIDEFIGADLHLKAAGVPVTPARG